MFRSHHPPHLRKPLKQFLLGLVFFTLAIVALFVVIEKMLPGSGPWRSILAALPGLGLATFFYVLYSYLRHYDELIKQLTIKALAASAIGGIVTLFVSVTRASIGGYAEFNSGVIMVTMSATFVLAALLLNWRHR